MRACSSYTMCLMLCVTCNMSCVTCHLSHFTCHLSHVTCHVSPVTFYFLFFIVLQKKWCGASRWKVCYQRGLPRLVFFYLFDCSVPYCAYLEACNWVVAGQHLNASQPRSSVWPKPNVSIFSGNLFYFLFFFKLSYLLSR